MTTYQINFDSVTKTFDTQYPILLHEKGVSQQEYSQTIQHVSDLYQQTVLAQSSNVATVFKIGFIVFITGGFIWFGVAVAIMVLDIHMMALIPIIIFFSVLVIIMILRFVVSLRMMYAANTRFKTEATQFLEAENNNRYFAKGVQFLLKEINQVYSTRIVGKSPMLEVIVTNDAIHPNTLDIYQQPVIYQQQNTIDYYQQPVTSYLSRAMMNIEQLCS
jgi:hypothetical protein